MSYKRVIQLRGLKDKKLKRYLVNIKFYYKAKFLFQEKFDIHDMIIENEWKSISSSETIKLFTELFDIYIGQYPIPSKGFEIEGRSHWIVKEEDGYSICLKDEDLSKLRQKRIESLDIN
jgi:hypothetical protein